MKMTVGDALIIQRTIAKLLVSEAVNPETSQPTQKDRKLPFGIRYRLLQALDLLSKPLQEYEKAREELVREFGETTKREDGQEQVEVKDPEKLGAFYKRVESLVMEDLELNPPWVAPLKQGDVSKIEAVLEEDTEFEMNTLEMRTFSLFVVSKDE